METDNIDENILLFRKSNLLPPSHFNNPVSIPKQTDVKKYVDDDLTAATNEIEQLKEKLRYFENHKIREIESNKNEYQQVKTNSAFDHSSFFHTLQEIIDKQKQEILTLNNQIINNQKHFDKQISKLKTEFSTTNKQLQDELYSCKSQISILENDNENLEKNYKSKLDAKNEESNLIISNLQSNLNFERDGYSQKLEKLKSEKENLEYNFNKLNQEFQSYKANAELTINNQSEEINKLKAYLSENKLAESERTSQRLIKTLQSKILSLEKEAEILQSTANNTNKRFDSQNEILKIQENEMIKTIDKREQGNNLLTKWRQQVWKLLVNSKCSEDNYNNEKNSWNNEKNKLCERLEEIKSEKNILKHLVDDKTAENDSLKREINHLKENLENAERIAIEIDDYYSNEMKNVKCIYNSAKCFSTTISKYDKINSEILSKLMSFERRISYAGNRMQFIQDQISRKNTINDKKKIVHEEKIDENQLKIELNDLRMELKRLSNERNLLINQIKCDNKLAEDKIRIAEKKGADEIEQLKNRIEELHAENSVVSEKIKYLQNTIEELTEEKEDLKLQLNNEKENFQQAIDEQKKIIQDDYSERLSDLERKLLESRKEQTKCVLKTRDLERKIDKLNSKNIADTKNLLDENQSLTKELETLKRNNNLLILNATNSDKIKYVEREKPIDYDENKQVELDLSVLINDLDELSSETLRDQE